MSVTHDRGTGRIGIEERGRSNYDHQSFKYEPGDHSGQEDAFADAAVHLENRYGIDHGFRARSRGLNAGGPGSGCRGENCGRKAGTDTLMKKHNQALNQRMSKLKQMVVSGKFKGGWKRGGRNEGEGYLGHFTSFYDHPKHGLLEIKHGGPFRENPVRVKHNGTLVSNTNHDDTRRFLKQNYGIRYGSKDTQGF